MTTKPNKHISVNVTLRADRLAEAKALHIKLSQTLESALRDASPAAWLAQNRQGIEALNASVASHGIFSRGRRTF